MTAHESKRYHSLDGVRAFAMLLGIALHASLPYIYLGFPWFVMDRQRSGVLTLLVFTIHTFRMPVFFLVAGFFARLLWHRLGPRRFWRHRLARIALPLAVGWIVLYPVMRALWVMSMVWIRHPGDWPRIARGVSAVLSLRYIHRGLTFLHLWFLYYLLVLYALFVLIRWVWSWLDRGAVLAVWADRFVRWTSSSRIGVLVLAALLTPTLLLMKVWGVDLPDRSFIPRTSHLLFYGAFFGFGWLLNRQPELLGRFRSRWLLFAGLFVLALVPELWMVMWIYTPHHRMPPVGRITFFFLYALVTWSALFAILGSFEAWLTRERKVWRYLADASYWLYLVHLPLVVFLSVLLRPLPWSPWLKWLTALLLSSPVLLVSYDLLVRPTWIGKWLNGRRYPRWLARSVSAR